MGLGSRYQGQGMNRDGREMERKMGGRKRGEASTRKKKERNGDRERKGNVQKKGKKKKQRKKRKARRKIKAGRGVSPRDSL